MNEIVFVWLLLGVAIGLLMGQALWRSSSRQTPAVAALAAIADPASNPSTDIQSLQTQLQEIQLAYGMAVQMSQFKGNFLARTSHEVRSPLSGLIGMHQLILADLCDNAAEEREFITQAHASALRMVKVLDEVIDAAKVEQGTTQLEPQPIQLAELLEEVYDLTHLQAQNRNLRLTIVPVEHTLVFSADLRRLRQALTGLVDAAIAQMSEGQITISSQLSADCHIWIETPIAAAAWTADFSHFATQPDGALSKSAIAQLADQPFPSPGFTILLARSLLRSMGGGLEIVEAPATDGSQVTRIDCHILVRSPKLR